MKLVSFAAHRALVGWTRPARWWWWTWWTWWMWRWRRGCSSRRRCSPWGCRRDTPAPPWPNRFRRRRRRPTPASSSSSDRRRRRTPSRSTSSAAPVAPFSLCFLNFGPSISIWNELTTEKLGSVQISIRIKAWLD